MKTALIILALTLAMMVSGCYTEIRTAGQNGPPPWAPAHGWRSHHNYYFPDYEIYYHVHTAQFIYYSGTTWIYVSSLPTAYAHIDLWTCRKIVVSYKGKDPYSHINTHRKNHPKKQSGEKIKKENKNKSKDQNIKQKKKVDQPKKTEKNKNNQEKNKGNSSEKKKKEKNNPKSGKGKK
jgi:hypothetical protein